MKMPKVHEPLQIVNGLSIFHESFKRNSNIQFAETHRYVCRISSYIGDENTGYMKKNYCRSLHKKLK